MPDQNKIKILLSEYSNLYLAVLRTEGLIKALKTLPQEIKLEAKIEITGPGLPPTIKERTVRDRLKEVERDHQILKARFEAIKGMLELEPGGSEALKKWVWQPPKE